METLRIRFFRKQMRTFFVCALTIEETHASILSLLTTWNHPPPIVLNGAMMYKVVGPSFSNVLCVFDKEFV